MNDRTAGVAMLCLPYAPLGFLINKQQCSSSSFIADTRMRAEPLPWLTEDLIDNEQRIPLFDLDAYLQSVYRVERRGTAELALLYTIRDADRAADSVFCGADFAGVQTMGFRVTSETSMQDVGLKDLQVLPSSLAAFLQRHGCLAVSLHTRNGGPCCLLDLPTIVSIGLYGENT